MTVLICCCRLHLSLCLYFSEKSPKQLRETLSATITALQTQSQSQFQAQQQQEQQQQQQQAAYQAVAPASGAEDSPEQETQRMLDALKLLKYRLPAQVGDNIGNVNSGGSTFRPEAFARSLHEGDRSIITHVLLWLLTNWSQLQMRSYVVSVSPVLAREAKKDIFICRKEYRGLASIRWFCDRSWRSVTQARFLVDLQIPDELRGDEDIMSLQTDVTALQVATFSCAYG